MTILLTCSGSFLKGVLILEGPEVVGGGASAGVGVEDGKGVFDRDRSGQAVDSGSYLDIHKEIRQSSLSHAYFCKSSRSKNYAM